MKIMATSFKRARVLTASLSAPDPAAGRRRSISLQENPEHSQASLGQSLMGHCPFLLVPCMHKLLFVPSKSLFHQSCVSSIIKTHWPPKVNSLGVLSPFARPPGWFGS